MNRLDKTLLITVLLLGGILWLQHRWTIRLTEERDRFRMNSTALLSDVKRMRTDSATMALDAKALRRYFFSLNCNLVCNNDIYSFCRTVFVINVFQTKVCPHSIYYLFFLFWLVL